MRTKVLALVASLLIAGLGLTLLVDRLMGFGDTELEFHGMLAMILGIVLTMALGIGLMALVFLSARRGYDARAAERSDSGREER